MRVLDNITVTGAEGDRRVRRVENIYIYMYTVVTKIVDHGSIHIYREYRVISSIVNAMTS